MADEHSIGLAVSGGGYRATLYALGSFWRLNEFGMLPALKTITSVSGGSILTGYLAVNWTKLQFDANGVAANFEELIAKPLQAFCAESLDIMAGISGLLSFSDTIGDKVAKAYDKRLFNGASIQSLSDTAPDFLFYGTNYQTGSSLRIEKSGISDYKLGKYPTPDIPIAKVVGISSAFPPMLSPVTLTLDPNKWVDTKAASYGANASLRNKMLLTDGGLYDNMGLEAIWKGRGRYSHVLVCDAGAPFKVKEKIKTNWVSQLMRMTDLMTDQQRALRKRTLMANYRDVDALGNHKVYGGAYFGIGTKIDKYEYPKVLVKDNALTASLKNIRTRLNAFTAEEQAHLINWGYTLADAAVNTHASELIKVHSPAQWPQPKFQLR